VTPWLTVGELLTERLRRSVRDPAARRARIIQTLELIGLRKRRSRPPSELSGGQRQRVACPGDHRPAQGAAVRRPHRALDVSLAATVLRLIRDLRRELGITVLFVTHDLGVARIIADRIAVMYLGRLVEWARPTR